MTQEEHGQWYGPLTYNVNIMANDRVFEANFELYRSQKRELGWSYVDNFDSIPIHRLEGVTPDTATNKNIASMLSQIVRIELTPEFEQLNDDLIEKILRHISMMKK